MPAQKKEPKPNREMNAVTRAFMEGMFLSRPVLANYCSTGNRTRA
jgi:hypothetical protein